MSNTKEPRVKIADYEVITHGINSSDYFTGCGTGVYEHVVTGIGETPSEALDDALEMLHSSHLMAEPFYPDLPFGFLDGKPIDHSDHTEREDEEDMCSLHYWVSIQYDLDEVPEEEVQA